MLSPLWETEYLHKHLCVFRLSSWAVSEKENFALAPADDIRLNRSRILIGADAGVVLAEILTPCCTKKGDKVMHDIYC